jgi:hypothetical protein
MTNSEFKNALGWATLVGFVSFFWAEQVLGMMNPAGYHSPWPSVLARPASLELVIWCLNISLLFALIAGVISVPIRASIFGLGLTLIYLAYCYVLFVMY